MFARPSPQPQPSKLLSVGGPGEVISDQDLSRLLSEAYGKIRMSREVLLVPPDGSRPDAHAPFLLGHALRYFDRHNPRVIPALGTHKPMSGEQITEFFGSDAPRQNFLEHNAERDTALLGVLPKEQVLQLTDGLCNREFPVQVNKLIDGKRLVIAFSHVIPHEVMGMAGGFKHILVGLGGPETISMSHEVAALFGIDDTLGRVETPSRRLLNAAHRTFLADKNILYVLIVRSPARAHEHQLGDEHGMITRGVFVGDGEEVFDDAARLAMQVNITVVQPLEEAVVYLPPENYRAFWVAMKGCYRMRLAMQEGGTLHVVCPGVTEFGENARQSDIIGRYGYVGWSSLKRLYDGTPELQKNAGIWAHLTHGSPPEVSPGTPKFRLIVYPKMKDPNIVDSVGFTPEQLCDAHLTWGDHKEIMARFSLTPDTAVGYKNGVYFGGNPAKGLWVTPEASARL